MLYHDSLDRHNNTLQLLVWSFDDTCSLWPRRRVGTCHGCFWLQGGVSTGRRQDLNHAATSEYKNLTPYRGPRGAHDALYFGRRTLKMRAAFVTERRYQLHHATGRRKTPKPLTVADQLSCSQCGRQRHEHTGKAPAPLLQEWRRSMVRRKLPILATF